MLVLKFIPIKFQINNTDFVMRSVQVNAVININIRKVFDSVDLSILMKKLKSNGIEYYLTDKCSIWVVCVYASQFIIGVYFCYALMRESLFTMLAKRDRARFYIALQKAESSTVVVVECAVELESSGQISDNDVKSISDSKQDGQDINNTTKNNNSPDVSTSTGIH
ncbi:hypothetical protein QTP88_022539 [Uroleucon formosanum]